MNEPNSKTPTAFNHCRDIILDSIADGVFTVDEDWRITSFNRAAERILGLTAEEALGRPCCEVFRSSICESTCALRQTLQTGKPIINRAIYVVNAEGERIPISISTAILKDNTGNIVGGVETFRDLSMVEELKKELHKHYSFGDIIGCSSRMQRLFELLPLVAESDSTVLVQGGSGTGKELVARAIHECSKRKQAPFVAVNCGALPDTLLESELFGYKAGAFTDARRDKPGRFALAEGGTIFLDEIGDISPAMQTRLLRVLQERQFEPLGSVKPIITDVRIIAATNKDLDKMIKQGSFREDLYYRINVMTLHIPALRERKEDIPLLIDHFISKFNRLQSKDISGVSEEAMGLLMRHDYPGNIRELENIIEHAFILCSSGLIHPHHLPSSLLKGETTPTSQLKQGLSLQAMEILLIQEALRRHNGNRKQAAKELGIDPSTLFRKIKAYEIDITTIT